MAWKLSGSGRVAIALLLLATGVLTDKPPNILFLMADDLRVQLNFTMRAPQQPFSVTPDMVTPSLDGLAARSMVFQRAYVQFTLCNPSRSSALTSRRPDTTKVYSNDLYFRDTGGDFTTIPQFFKDHGYNTVGVGKIFHEGNLTVMEDSISWSKPTYDSPNFKFWCKFQQGINKGVKPYERQKTPLPDDQIVDKALEALRVLAQEAREHDKPFFLAVGFHKPHQPFVCPAEILDYYPSDTIRMPSNPYAPVDMPAIAFHQVRTFLKFVDLKPLKADQGVNSTHPIPEYKMKEIRRAYYSCVSYIDSFIGQVLAELQAQGLVGDTIVSFWGDHGFHLGEHGALAKQTNFEVNTRVPFTLYIPGVTDNGLHTDHLVEMVDLFPTLVESAGFPPLPRCPQDSSIVQLCTEGSSLLPLIYNPEAAWKNAAFFQVERANCKFMGYGVRTDKFRYTEWVGMDNGRPNWSDNQGVELYDTSIDPEENVNRIHKAGYEDIAEDLSEKLRLGWRAIYDSNNK